MLSVQNVLHGLFLPVEVPAEGNKETICRCDSNLSLTKSNKGGHLDYDGSLKTKKAFLYEHVSRLPAKPNEG